MNPRECRPGELVVPDDPARVLWLGVVVYLHSDESYLRRLYDALSQTLRWAEDYGAPTCRVEVPYRMLGRGEATVTLTFGAAYDRSIVHASTISVVSLVQYVAECSGVQL